MKQYHNNLYGPMQKEVYKILGSYGIDKPKSNMVIELCNLIIDHVEGAYESGFTHANNDWAFKTDAVIAKKLKSTKVDNDYRIITANTDVPYGDPEK